MTTIICGLDECGRGALAGPLCAAAVSLNCPKEHLLNYVNTPIRDSKKLSKIQRKKLVNRLKDTSLLSITISSIEVAKINSNGIGWANKQIFLDLIAKQIDCTFIIDGNLTISFPGKTIRNIVNADNLFLEVSLASIFTKVYRDQLMSDLSVRYPQYQWDQNMGYGTPAHISALKKYGATPHHRTQFVATALANSPELC